MHAQDGRRLVAVAAGAALALGAGSATAPAAPVVTEDPEVIARAIVADEATLTGAAFTAKPTDPEAEEPGTPAPTAATFAADAGGLLGGFPLAGSDAGLLSTGAVTDVPGDQANQVDREWEDDDAVIDPLRGETVNDLTTLRVDVNVPAGANCLALSYRFLSEEFPEFVGSNFNDAFIAELDNSTWRTDDANSIVLPDDFATKAGGKPVSVNGVGPTSVAAIEGAGTVFDAATGLVTTKTTVTPGAHSVYFSIFDQTDRIYDSAVMLDRLAFITEAPDTCKPPEVTVIPPPPPPPPGPPAPPPPVPPPANDISIPGGSVTFRNGAATITIQVPGPGTLSAAQASSAASASRRAAAAQRGKKRKKKFVKPASVVAKQAGPVKLKLRLTKAGKQRLRKRGKLKVALAVTFTPTGGSANTETRTLTIKAKKKKRGKRG
jgi:hypothetical protein